MKAIMRLSLIKMPIIVGLTAFSIAHSAVADTQQKPLYKDASQPTEQRVKDLLGRMTLEEKVAQMICVWQGKRAFLTEDGSFNAAGMSKAHPNGIGCVARPQDTVKRRTRPLSLSLLRLLVLGIQA